MKVLSLFNGMSVAQMALEKNGVKDITLYSSEIKPHAIKVTQENFPNTIQIGDVTKVSFNNGVLTTENGVYETGEIDLVLGGSPCQDFSSANKNPTGLNGLKSSLFFHFLRILKEVDPKYFLLENVSSMKKEDKKQLDYYMGCEGFEINSLNFVPQMRKRLYWTNIEVDEVENKRCLSLQDVLTEGYTPKEYSTCLLEAHSRPNKDKLKLTRRHLEKGFIPIVYKSKKHYLDLLAHYNANYRGLTAKEVDSKRYSIDNSIYEGVRILNQREMEILQGVKPGFTSSVDRNKAASLLGDGWTVDVISHILKNIK